MFLLENLLDRVYLLQARVLDQAKPREPEDGVENVHHVAGPVREATELGVLHPLAYTKAAS